MLRRISAEGGSLRLSMVVQYTSLKAQLISTMSAIMRKGDNRQYEVESGMISTKVALIWILGHRMRFRSVGYMWLMEKVRVPRDLLDRDVLSLRGRDGRLLLAKILICYYLVRGI